MQNEVGLLVADEIHMIGDGARGAIYEMLVSKVKYTSSLIINQNKKKLASLDGMSEELKYPIQIVATTATIQNKKELATYLDAILFERHFRPIELKE